MDLTPKHADPFAEKEGASGLESTSEGVASEEGDEGVGAEPEVKNSGPWMKWLMAHQPDFEGQDNLLTTVVKKHGQTIMFLPKFHCE